MKAHKKRERRRGVTSRDTTKMSNTGMLQENIWRTENRPKATAKAVRGKERGGERGGRKVRREVGSGKTTATREEEGGERWKEGRKGGR